MKQTIEVPDKTINPEQHPNDQMDIYVKKNEIIFRIYMDGTGNEFILDRYELLKLIHKPTLRRTK